MARYEQVKANEWINPTANGYKMACCDCGLVHDIDFRPAYFRYNRKEKKWHVSFIKKAGIVFRVRRNNRATASLRRHMKHG